MPWFSKFQLTSDLYHRLLPSLISELRRQVLIHKLVARLNLYFKLQTDPQNSSYIPYLWTMLYDTIKLAVQQNTVIEYPADNHWLHLPGHPPGEFQDILNRKNPIFHLWRGRASQEASNHAETLIRSVFNHFGYKQPPHKFAITDETTGEECIPDAFTFSPVLTGAEVKNITSDVISDPSPLVGKPKQDLYTKIERHFRLCLANGIHPLLIAPRIDPSFERFEEKYKGLHCEMFYQLLPLHHATLCQAIHNILLFPYVLAVDINPPFPPELDRLTNWVQHLPSFLAKYT
jgi:hypothetical protein